MEMVEIEKALGCECLRCGYRWWKREPGREPVYCAKCHSPYWNKERVRAVSGTLTKKRPFGPAKAGGGGKGAGETRYGPVPEGWDI